MALYVVAETLIGKLGILTLHDAEISQWFEEDSMQSVKSCELAATVQRLRTGIRALDAALKGSVEVGADCCGRQMKRARMGA